MYPNDLTDLALLWEEWYEQGVDVPAEELGRDRPDLVAGLRQRIDALKGLAWLNRREDSAEAEEAPAAPDLGHFPHLRLERVIGQGGFARVWSGFHLRLHRPVAVKVFGQGYGHFRSWQESLRQEAERVGRLHHPGIVPLLEIGENEEWGYLAFPLVSGGNLRQLLARGRPTVRQAARIVADVCMALNYCHHQGIVHRDVKPDNVLLDRHGRTYLTDFGIAVRKGDLRLRGTEGAGTPAYLSPEQVLDCAVSSSNTEVLTLRNGPRTGLTRLIDPRTDVWSVGVVLYELLTGQHPFAGLNGASLREAILSREPTPPGHLVPEVTADVESICLRCLAKDPRDRYLGGLDLARDLRQTVARLPEPPREVPSARPSAGPHRTGLSFRTLQTVVDCVPGDQ